MKIKAYFFAQIVFGIIFFVIFGFWLKARCAINCNNHCFNGAGTPLKFNAV